MKKTMTALAACAVLAVGAVPAHAAPEDPVRALTTKPVAGHGVRFTETATVVDGLEERQQKSRFDSKGVAALDITATTIDSERTDHRHPARMQDVRLLWRPGRSSGGGYEV
ncbi:hypothetical protein E1286_19825 [Nonomuraea terrae]|uniref:Uncharacterized protein n=1 Tax=Nonomuraea terrae TaxID=2530383 RepID=A0A4R4YQB1_9ACTN|nr:hypothetical protein [Nonomuraea terrae]TDD46790.1 hypothetical protein E1286_19825 [Nonomuraea terrae]